mgnify:CR=1 FL=1|jgi:hypothetical protein
MGEILTFFKTILAKYFAKDTGCKELADIAGNIFDWTRTLHQRALTTQASAEAVHARDRYMPTNS